MDILRTVVVVGAAFAAVGAAGRVAAAEAAPVPQAAHAAPVPHPAHSAPVPQPAVLALLHAHAARVHATADDTFEVRGTVTDADGATHVRVRRRHAGLRVIGGDLVLHTAPGGGWKGLDQTLRAPVGRTHGTRTAAEAIAYATTLTNAAPEEPPTAEAVIYARDTDPTPAFDVTVRTRRADGTPSITHHVLDASSLQQLDHWDDIHTEAAQGLGHSLLAGDVNLDTDHRTGGDYALRDLTRGGHVTADMHDQTRGTGDVFTDADNTWGTGATNSRATVATDAHYGLQLTWDYYRRVHGRNGIDDRGTGTRSRVHYGSNYSNAFWSDDCFCMTYGDGDGRTWHPLVAIDVAGHEMTHGVTSSTADLYYSGESGGLNESTSDIFGTLVEFDANNPKSAPNYLMGERLYVSNDGIDQPTKALRYLYKPSLDGSSPDCWSSSVARLDPHESSGIGNHFFYLLAEGARPPANTGLAPADLVCDGNTALTGIGREAAGRIWYRALTVYMTSGTNYAGARRATLSAAQDLYGSGSREASAVAAAWTAVNVR